MKVIGGPVDKVIRKGHNRGQGMVEFALVFPLLLLLLFGIFELGRIMFTYSATMAASREAARYGAAILDVGGGIPQYEDCAGIRAAAKRIGQYAGIDDANITIQYSNDGGIYSTACPPSQEVQAADTISVSINTSVTPVTPVGNFSPIPINSSSSRTILKSVKLGASGTGAGSVSGKLSDVNFKTTNQTAEETQGTISVVVELNEVTTNQVTVPFSTTGTAIKGTDYQITSSPIIINPGQKTATIYITLNNDGLLEGEESLILGIDTPINATRGPQYIHTIKIVDPPDISFAAVSSSQPENAGVIGLMVELSKGSTQDVTVSFKHTGNAAWGASGDYVTSPASLTIPSGSLSGMLVVDILDDPYDEVDEIALISLTSPVNGLLGSKSSHSLTIIDDDAPPQLSFFVDKQVVSEEIGLFTTTLTLSELSGKTITLPYTLSGTTTSGDYTIHDPSPLVIPPGTGSVDIQMDIHEGDGLEEDETLIISLGTPQFAVLGSPSEQTIIITESSTEPTINFASASTSLVEGDQVINLYVQLSNAWISPVYVSFSATGTAQQGLGQDYLMSTSPLEIPVGWTQGLIQVLIQDDVLDEPIEDILISLDAAVNGLLGTTTTHQITIKDNDVPPKASFSSMGQSVTEYYGAVSIAVELDKPSLYDVAIPLYLSGSAILNSDYTISTQNLIIPAGALKGTFQISVVDDLLYDPGEVVLVTLGTPTNADLGTPKTFTLAIEDDELSPCEVGSHLLTIGSDSFSLSMVNEGQAVLFTGGSVTWVDSGGNNPRLVSIDFAGTEVFSGDEKPTYFSYPTAVNFASLDTQVLIIQFDDLLGAGTHTLVSNFHNLLDGTTCSLTETFTVY
jgi:Flp pilus assembly protein TadG